MADASTFRDSTQIVLPAESLSGLRDDVEREFTVTVVENEDRYRIIGSPVVIKDLSDFLARHGVTLP